MEARVLLSFWRPPLLKRSRQRPGDVRRQGRFDLRQGDVERLRDSRGVLELSKLCFDASYASQFDQYKLTLTSAVAFGDGAASVLPAPARGQQQAVGANRWGPRWAADLARGEPEALPDTHGPVGREVMEAIRLSLTATR